MRVFAREGVRAVEDDRTLEGVARLERREKKKLLFIENKPKNYTTLQHRTPSTIPGFSAAQPSARSMCIIVAFGHIEEGQEGTVHFSPQQIGSAPHPFPAQPLSSNTGLGGPT